MFMKHNVAKRYGKQSFEYGFFCYVMKKRDSDYTRYVYKDLMK